MNQMVIELFEKLLALPQAEQIMHFTVFTLTDF